MNRTWLQRTLPIVISRVNASWLQFKIIEHVVPPIFILVVQQESSRNKLASLLPPNEMMFVNVSTSVLDSWISTRSHHEHVRSVLHLTSESTRLDSNQRPCDYEPPALCR